MSIDLVKEKEKGYYRNLSCIQMLKGLPLGRILRFKFQTALSDRDEDGKDLCCSQGEAAGAGVITGKWIFTLES